MYAALSLYEQSAGRKASPAELLWIRAGIGLLHGFVLTTGGTIAAQLLRKKLSASGRARLLFVLFVVPAFLILLFFFPYVRIWP
jgi:hypothetical protein